MTNFLALWTATIGDALSGANSWRLWSRFAWHDLLARYRRSWLGPFWLALSAATFIAALSFVYGTLLQQPMREYLPFVAIGIACWSFISAVATEAVTTFVESENYIRQVRTSLFIYVFRVFWRNVLVFLHQFAIAVIILLIFGELTSASILLAVLGLLLLFLQALWVIPLLGLIGARYRDMLPIIANVLQVLIFITPVIWFPSALGSRRWIADINPLHSLIAVVREPLLGSTPSVGAYVYVGLIAGIGILLVVLLYGRFRNRVVYWL